MLPVDGAAAPNDLAAFNNTPVVMQRISNDNGKSERLCDNNGMSGSIQVSDGESCRYTSYSPLRTLPATTLANIFELK